MFCAPPYLATPDTMVTVSCRCDAGKDVIRGEKRSALPRCCSPVTQEDFFDHVRGVPGDSPPVHGGHMHTYAPGVRRTLRGCVEVGEPTPFTDVGPRGFVWETSTHPEDGVARGQGPKFPPARGACDS